MSLPEEALRVLRARSFAHIAVTDARGRPHVSPLWVDVDDDGRVVINTAEGRVKARALQMGTWVALSICDPESPYHYVLIRGRVVERTHEGAQDVIEGLAEKYHGKRTFDSRGQQRVTIRIEPERVLIPQ